MNLASIGVSAREQMAWQEKLANTAHVREVADLKAAGLNPVLSAKLGGAAVPSGANDLAQLAALNSAGSSSGGHGGSGSSNDVLSDGSLLGDIINGLNPNGSSRFGKWSIPNWMIQYVYGKAKEMFGDDLSVPTFTGMLNDETGANVSPSQVNNTMENESHYGMDDEGWESRGWKTVSGDKYTLSPAQAWRNFVNDVKVRRQKRYYTNGVANIRAFGAE